MGDLVLNGVHYSISGNLYYPVIYSDTERKIGVWRDNKPLYQKTILVTSIVSGNNTINHGISNVDKIVKTFGTFFSNANNSSPIPNGNLQTAWSVSMFDFGTTNFTISVGSSWVQYFDYIQVTLQYTKTTDTAGSGNWNTDGIPTHHYSTNEQVVGTYLNKPLYERVIEINNPDYNWSVINLESYFPNVEKAFLGDMFRATRTDGVVICKPDFYYTDYDRLSFLIAENADNLRVSGYLLSKVAVAKIEFSVRYTKTTD